MSGLIPLQGCGRTKHKIYPLGKRQYPVEQKYAEDGGDGSFNINPRFPHGTFLRVAQELTKDQKIAIQEHYIFHVKLGNSGAKLNKHIELMEIAIRNGKSFIEAHTWAIKYGGAL